ncbi:uncharacterized protein LOC143301802 [Babylonia areolata]|uniref:uncharacterized protein LOC143301802 n=1 Tax=Babylonia areolata TaxID=304850 RepID=UPI003FD0A029
MRVDLRPSKSSDLVPFQTCCVQALESCEFTNSHCGLSEDGCLTWVYKGPVLEVASTSMGHRVASLNALHLLRDEDAVVTCVCEFPCQGRPHLVAALRGSAEQSMLVLLNVATSLVVKAVEIPHQVTAVERVLTYGGGNVPSWAFSEQLRQFHGIVAVGTEGGYIYLVDMALDWSQSIDRSQKIAPCPLHLLEPRERDVQAVRQQAFLAGQHLALLLGVDEQMHSNDCFHFRGPDLSVRQTFNEEEVHVSSLKYIPQIGTLAIGYSFGGFHLWKLFNPVIEFASSVEAEDLPVAFFVYQEPENDPKNFAYLWVCRDDRLSEQKQESICSISLYQLSYSRRTFYASYGNFFEELNLVTLRLDHNLTVEPYNTRNTTTWSSQLLSAFSITDPNYRPPARLTINDSYDEGCQGPDLSLCAFVWEAQDSRPGNSSQVFLAVFDMNRWYHAQMPSRIKCVNAGGQEMCPFLAVYRMNDAVYKEGCETVVDIQIKPGSLLRFVSDSPMPPEQHFYPSSLAFDAVCVLSNGIVLASILGVQRQVLASLESSGPLCLLKPFDLYHRCVQTGLMARSSDSSSALSVEEQQRMSLLTLALEQGQIRFIIACIRSWADGDYIPQGCSLQFILSWAWARVTAIKQQIDTTCQPLFDWSEAPVDQRMLQVLENCLCCLGHLRIVLHNLLTRSSPVTDQGQVELEHRIRVVTLLHGHLRLMLWFVHTGLLPEHQETEKSSPMHYVYPASELSQVFADRRRQMTQSPSGANTHEMILIDALVHSAGETLSQLWKNEEGTGMYPPPSLHAALSVYLLDGVEEKTKTAIVLYLLFDIAAVAHGQQEEFAEKIPKFARAFDLPLGLVQQIHGFWLIDHMNFQEGLNQLRLRFGQDLGPWQHACILRALMHQGETAAALRYLSMRNPPVLTAEDLKMRLSILIANRLVSQAVMFVRNTCGSEDQQAMLKHIFSQCQHQKLMNVLMKLPLTDNEEKCFQSYLLESTDSTAAELLVLHLLQRAQYVPAIRLNDRLKHRATMDLSSKARERSKTRNIIVDGFRRSLPVTQQYLINNPSAPARIPATRKIEVPRPKPLSTVVTQRAEHRANSQSAMILAVMDKVAEAGKLLAEEEGLGEEEREEEEEVGVVAATAALPPSRQSRSTLGQKKEVVVESGNREPLVVTRPGPFLCTPTTTPRLHSGISRAGQVVFPTVKDVTQALVSSAARASPVSPTVGRRSQLFTADCLSLLQTPKIDHTAARVASPIRRTTTPHSILKVSHLPRTSPMSRGVGKAGRGQPKRLGFSTSASHSPSLPSTPTSITPSSTPSPMSSQTAQVDWSKTEKSASEAAATPKQIRFAEPEIREISPRYVSPDSLSRPPLHVSPDKNKQPQQDQDSSQQESSNEEAIPLSDEEITFNMSRQVAEPMEMEEEEENTSTLPLSTPSPTADRTPHHPPHILSSASEPISVRMEEEQHQERVESRLRPGEKNASPDTSPGGRLTRPTLHEEESEAPSASPLRDRSPLSVRTRAESETASQRHRLSPQGSPASLLLRVRGDQQETMTQTSVFTETRHTSLVSSGEMADRYELRIVSEQTVKSGKETTVVLEKTSSHDALPIVECDKEAEAAPASSAESLETIEPAEDRVLTEARQASGGQENVVEEPQRSDTVEVSADEDVLDLDIQVPTPIKRSSRRSTPERLTRSARTSRRTGLKIDLSEVEKDQEKTEPTPPKLRRISPAREKPPEELEWPVSMPPLRLEGSDDDVDDVENNSNENNSQPSPPSSPFGRSEMSRSPPVSPSDSSGRQSLPGSPARRTAQASRSPPPSPSRKSTRNSDRSPPPSPLHRASGSKEKSSSAFKKSTRSMDRSPPVSPSRRSTRSVDRSPPPSPSQRSTRSVDRSPPASPSRRSTRTVDDHSPPVSPSRRSRRSVDRSPPPPSQRSTRSVDRSPPVSPSRRSTRSVDRSPPPPSLRSTRSVDRSPPPSLRSTRSVDRSPPVSPSRRSTRSVDRSPPPSPSRAVRQTDREQGKRPEGSLPVTKPIEEPLTIQTESSDVEMMPPPVSPSRRSSRLRTPERSPGRKGRTPERTTTKADTGAQNPDRDAESGASSGGATSADAGSSHAQDPTPKSPTRRSQRSNTPDIAKPPASKPETPPMPEQTDDAEGSQSPSRRKVRRRKDIEAPSSPSRRSTLRSKTPDLVSEPASPSRRTRQQAKASDVSSAASPPTSGKGEEVARRETSPTSADRSEPEEPVTSPSRRLARSRSKTPERSTAHTTTRLRGKGKADQSESIVEETKDITVATEEVRSLRKQQRDSSPRSAVNVSSVAQETGDAPSFQFAPPTPLSRVQEESMPAPTSDVSAFIFSPPITRTTRSKRGPTSSTRSTRSRARNEESVSFPEEPQDRVPEDEGSAGQDQPDTTTTTKKKTTAKRRKKTSTRSTIPNASPSDSPINLVSPGEPASSETPPDPASKGASRKVSSTGANRSRVLRKRKAKLW